MGGRQGYIQSYLNHYFFSVLDINECTTGTHRCQEVCHDTQGSYYCTCSTVGYRLHSDGTSCQSWF